MADRKTCATCNSQSCSAAMQRPDESAAAYAERQALAQRLCQIKHKILVLSGKGGVGKSTVAVNLAVALSLAGKRVGLMDIDIHGPSIPKLLRLEDHAGASGTDGLAPATFGENLKVMSIGFLLHGRDDAVIWRGPMKMGAIKQFLKDVDWGELDYLVIDSPPGTGDEPLSVCQLIEDPDGAVIVTTPQALALADVRRSITFCRRLDVHILGVVENMSGFVCPKCGETVDVFGQGGGETMAREMSVPFLGRIPMDADVVQACDAGRPYVQHAGSTSTADAFRALAQPVLELDSRVDLDDTTV